MENIKNITEKDYKDFFEWILERNIELDKEFDTTLCSSTDEPYVFYPKEIGEFIQTRPMQRLKKIEQLGTSILSNVDACHSRYTHCLGTYHNAVIFYILQFMKNSVWRERIEKEGRKVEVLADIMEALRHDDGHNILSHSLEKLIGFDKGTHELLGQRFKNELPETIQALNNIHPDLLSAMNKVSSKEYDLITLREGNLDFDRLDFISRDSLYLGLPEVKKISYELLRRSNIVTFPTNGNNREMLIYDYEAMPFIEEFIQTRANLYQKCFCSNERKAFDILQEEFCNIFLDSDISSGKRLREYLKHCKVNSAESMDLEQFLYWNDLKYYNELIDIAMNSEDINIRNIAMSCIPNKEGLCSFAIESLNPRYIDSSTYTDEDKLFLSNVKSILKKGHPLHDKLEGNEIRAEVVVLNAKNQAEVEKVMQSLRKKGLSATEIDGITTWHESIKKYNIEETVFVKDKKGNVFPLQHHPELTIDLSPIYISGALLLPSKLRRLGVPEEKIEIIKNEFEEFNKKYPLEVVPTNRKMRKFEEGETPKIPNYENKCGEEK